jgi:hypothetical protein
MKKSILIYAAIPLFLASCTSTGWNATDYLFGNNSTANQQELIANKIAGVAGSDNPGEKLASDAVNNISSNVAIRAAEAIDQVVPNSRTEISATGFDVSNGRVEISNVTGINSSEDGRSQSFLQSSALGTKEKTVINIGLGHRYLTNDEKYLLGANMFYDYDTKYGHQRYSIGAELKSSTFEMTANSYKGLSGWKDGKGTNLDKALNGYDIEVGAQLPYMPGTKAYLKQFKWDLIDAAPLKGTDYSIQFAHMFGSGLTLEVGKRNFEGTETDEDFAKMSYVLPFGAQQDTIKTSIFSKNMFENESMKSRMLDKVRRNNAIVVQTKFSSAVGGV